MTHAIIAALSLDFTAAFQAHIMFWSLPILAVAVLKNGQLTGNIMLDRFIYSGIALGFLWNCFFM